MIKLIGNMHGNEVVGREMLIAFSAYLLENFDTDQRVRNIVSQTDIHIMPSLNPDGGLYDMIYIDKLWSCSSALLLQISS